MIFAHLTASGERPSAPGLRSQKAGHSAGNEQGRATRNAPRCPPTPPRRALSPRARALALPGRHFDPEPPPPRGAVERGKSPRAAPCKKGHIFARRARQGTNQKRTRMPPRVLSNETYTQPVGPHRTLVDRSSAPVVVHAAALNEVHHAAGRIWQREGGF